MIQCAYTTDDEDSTAIKKTKKLKIRTNNFNFSSVINAWSKIGVHNAANHTMYIIEQMVEMGVALDTLSCMSVIEAWSKSRTDEARLRVGQIFGANVGGWCWDFWCEV